ncbi:MAG: ABC transporter substrate-binding protein [Flavobacteriales bacterium]|nr:ABC transporter substrate-binding protein [Flavobacteriales bacterium]
MRSVLFILLAFLLNLYNGFAQDVAVQLSDSIAKIEGNVYIIHVVQPKQTLFSIAKAYEVKLSRIAFDNPGVLDGLKLDQPLRILKSAMGETQPTESTKETLELDGHYVLYTVPKQQTLYAISKEYNTTVSAIIDANPELSEGLKVGSTIRIPTPKIFGDGNKEGERKDVKMEMVGLPDIVKRKEFVTQAETSSGKAYTIALMLPLYLDMNDTIEAKRIQEQPEEIYEKSEIALQFYEGFLMAMDSLNAIGYNVKLKVIDTENRAWKVKRIAETGGLKNVDLIIGPFYSKVFSEAAAYANQSCVPIVSPTIKGSNIILNSPNVFKMIAADDAMIGEMGRYLGASDSTNNMILHYGAADELAMVERFRSGLKARGGKPVSFRSYNIYTSGSDSIRNHLSHAKRNNIVVLSNNQVKLASLIKKISSWAEDDYIVAYAPNTWQTFKNLEIDYFDKLRLHMPVPFHVNYERLDVEYFVLNFREKFNAEPSSFAFRGYDLAMHFIRNLDGIKSQGVDYMQQVRETGLQSSFSWSKVPDGGFENSHAIMVDYTDLELKIATD